MGKGACFIFTRFVIYLTVLPELDGAQSLSYFLHGVPEWQSGHATCKQDGRVEWGVTSFMTVQRIQLGTSVIWIFFWFAVHLFNWFFFFFNLADAKQPFLMVNAGFSDWYLLLFSFMITQLVLHSWIKCFCFFRRLSDCVLLSRSIIQIHFKNRTKYGRHYLASL